MKKRRKFEQHRSHTPSDNDLRARRPFGQRRLDCASTSKTENETNDPGRTYWGHDTPPILLPQTAGLATHRTTHAAANCTMPTNSASKEGRDRLCATRRANEDREKRMDHTLLRCVLYDAIKKVLRRAAGAYFEDRHVQADKNKAPSFARRFYQAALAW
ncbi:hypothetical protein PWT90_04241 [Aphanocladium album]|nr:hypothetical protein PWT90_04241 [Aphanocladium album]